MSDPEKTLPPPAPHHAALFEPHPALAEHEIAPMRDLMQSYPPLRVTVLGSGTSTGVPAIGCPCKVCASTDPRNKRLRSSIKIETGGRIFLVDCGVDFRHQMLANPTPRIDAVLLTHTHADHVHGIDDLRMFTFKQRQKIPIYSTERFLSDIKTRFAYAFDPPQMGGGVPLLELTPILPGRAFEAHGMHVLPVEIMHGKLPILGFRLGKFAYLTDCSGIPDHTYRLLDGIETLIISGLRHEPHPTHFTVAQSMEAAEKLGVKRVFFIHMTCRLDHAETEAALPEWARLTYDGMTIEVD